MDGFARLIDAMGGIRIKAGGWVPISGETIDEANGIHGMPLGWIPAGDNTLDGYHALWYGRSREFVDDYARIARQQCVQQAMLKQLDPATLLAKFEDIVKAGTKVVDSNISSSQLGSFVDLAMKAKGQEMSRLTIGPPDFDASFSTVPDFDQIHQKVDALLAPAPAAGAAEDGIRQQDPAPGPLSAAGGAAGRTARHPARAVAVGLHPGDHDAGRRTDHRRNAEPVQAQRRRTVDPQPGRHERPVRAAVVPAAALSLPGFRSGASATDRDTQAVYELENVLRPYAWGSTTAIAGLLGRPASGGPEAELWIGAHPDSPSVALSPAGSAGAHAAVADHGGRRALDALIAEDPEHHLGSDSVAEFGPRLPFLLKVLAADSPLSLQVHPTLEQAREGFAREEAAGVDRAAAERNYKDDNHKPEMIFALTPFEALCGFRPAVGGARRLRAAGGGF